jgi:GNAT superfamily N-acetyltransferase
MMKIEVLDKPEQSTVDFLDNKIAEYNWERWEVSERLPIAVQVKNKRAEIIAGAAGRTFGNWLQLNTLWVCESQRGTGLGSEVLKAIEVAARQRGCTQVLLDTLNFQAMPFYQKHGYQTEWTQVNYPKTGCKYFMSKSLNP